jgi:hypothetical protein
MRKYYYGGEHYPDPTAYHALLNILREERRINRRSRQPRDGYYPFREVFERENYIPS